MHAHVNIWKLNDAGSSSSDHTAREVADQMKQQPGFHSYSLIRTGEHELVVVTMFESAAQLHAAQAAIDGQTSENIQHLTSGVPEQRNGDVIFHLDSSDETQDARR